MAAYAAIAKMPNLLSIDDCMISELGRNKNAYNQSIVFEINCEIDRISTVLWMIADEWNPSTGLKTKSEGVGLINALIFVISSNKVVFSDILVLNKGQHWL